MSRADGVDHTLAAVVVLAVVGLGLRLVGLGDRPFHWDEARVGVWALRFARTGAFEYRPVAGGPLPYHLARASLALFGATDAAARLPVAVVGGLLPLSALGLRPRLRDDETVLVALVLAVSPPLVYYGRVLRGDLLLAAAAFVAWVLAVRAFGTERTRPAYGAALAAAAAVAASGFVVATVACVAVAALVVLTGRQVATDSVEGLSDRLRARSTLLARLGLVFAAALVFLFAPRGGDVGLWSPTSLPAVFGFVFGEVPGRFYAVRVASRYADGATHPLMPFVTSLLRTLGDAALPTLSLAVVGVLHERYAGEGRAVVTFFTVWAAAGLLVFPTVAEVDGPWTAVHVLVPLSVPAAVGAARGLSYARRAVDREDAAAVAAALLLLVAGVVQVGGVLADEVYGGPTPDDALAGYAQPADDLEPFAANVSAARAEGAGTGVGGDEDPTVLYYGDRFHTPGWAEADGPPVPTRWGARLPLPWYVAREDATATSLPSTAALPENPPPVIVAGPATAGELRTELSAYERSRYRLGLWNREVVVFVRSS
jgi:uncharacterized protein (TIGR03663 family)